MPAILWLRLIWWFSAQPATESGNLSDRMLYRLMSRLSPVFASCSLDRQTASVEALSFFTRKAAHMFLYFCLSLLLFLAVSQLTRKFYQKAGWSVGLTYLAACVDEYHQTFVPGRSGELRDTLVDLTGALIMLLFLWILYWVRQQKMNPWLPLPIFAVPSRAVGVLQMRGPYQWFVEKFVPDYAVLPDEFQIDMQQILKPILWETLRIPAAFAFLLGLVFCAVLQRFYKKRTY